MSYGDDGSSTSNSICSSSGDSPSSRNSSNLGSSLSSRSFGGVPFSSFDSQGCSLSGNSTGAAQNADSAQQDRSAGTSFKPGVGVVGGEPYSTPTPTLDSRSRTGVQQTDSLAIAQHLSAIAAANKFNVDIGNYFDNSVPSSGSSTEAAGESLLGRAWNVVNTATQWTDKNIVTPGHQVYQHWIQEPINCAVNAFHNSVVPPANQTLGQKKRENSLQQEEKSCRQLDNSGFIENKNMGKK